MKKKKRCKDIVVDGKNLINLTFSSTLFFEDEREKITI